VNAYRISNRITTTCQAITSEKRISFYYKFLKFYLSPADTLSIKLKNPVF